jgi:hypothetical protein
MASSACANRGVAFIGYPQIAGRFEQLELPV